MAIITRYPFLTQARVEAASFLAVFRQGRLVRSGRGIAAWFATGGPTSLVEIPADDRDHVLNVSATTADFQTVSALGLATWIAKLAIGTVALGVFEVSIAKMRVFRVAEFLGGALLLGLLATVFLYVSQNL